MPEITDDPQPLSVVVREYILAVCAACSWNLNTTAAVLGIAVKTLYNHLHRYADEGLVVKREHPEKGWRRVTQPTQPRRAA